MDSDTPHTLESLEALPTKSAVIAVASSMGLDTDGTRREISARIVAKLESTPAAPAPDATQTITDTPASDTPADDASARSVAETETADPRPGPITEPAIVDAPAVAAAPAVVAPSRGVLSASARNALERIVGSYVGRKAAESEMPVIAAGIEQGLQPCVVVATGNARFAVRVFDQPFKPSDVSADLPPRRDGVVLNLARYLSSKNLLPRG